MAANTSSTGLAIGGGEPVRTAPWPQYPVFGDAEVEAAARVVRTSNLSSLFGEEANTFEREYAACFDSPHAIACSNGTTALHIAIACAGVGVGDEVIVTPYTFYVSATSVLMHNAIPVFADVEPETLGLDADAVADRMTARTKAIILVHTNGFPCAHTDRLMDLAESRGIALIEDCSHAHGAEFRGRKVGTIGHYGTFSFQHKKNLTLGEGGMITTRDEDLAEKARDMRTFRRTELGFNYRMPELQAAMGRVRLPRLEEENEMRRRSATWLDSALSGIPGIASRRPAPETTPVYYAYVLDYDEETVGVPRRRVVDALVAEGIPASAGYSPIYRHPTLRNKDAYNRGCPWSCPYYEAPEAERPSYEDGLCPVAEEYCDRRNIEIKIQPTCGEGEMADVAHAVKKVMEHVDELLK
ncbi:MAG: DegT/DnrJ/EryC1/StrS family aminotransferase [Candidatus Latescibacteria bacterium]|jgi:dTDP-4-amino-4,6-dideoxygalactose transaminase|nr:DegT/DnrJ/EryC1/StrS family aminotransferase [Candidatus Latescibacterota bacterium]